MVKHIKYGLHDTKRKAKERGNETLNSFASYFQRKSISDKFHWLL